MSLTEADLAAAGVAHLKAQGWTVAEEVPLESALRGQTDLGAARADIAARRGSYLGVLEAKLGLGFEIMAQAKRWRGHANYVWMLVPYARETEGRYLAFDVARRFGLGVWELREDGKIAERVEASLREEIDPELAHSILPEHENGKFARAGSLGGSANLATPLNRTLENLRQYVVDNPGTSVLAAVLHIKHHYRSNVFANHELTKLVRRGDVSGVHSGLQWKGTLWPTIEEARTGMPGLGGSGA